MAEEKVRYSDEELAEFKALIMEKLEQARKLYKSYHEIITQQDGNDTVDTSPTFKSYEEGSSLLSKEQAGSMAERQLKFIKALENALIRIENKTYGIDRNTVISAFFMLSEFNDSKVEPQDKVFQYPSLSILTNV